jgi:hypothetical protein
LLVFHAYFYWILIFKGLTARRLHNPLGVTGLTFCENKDVAYMGGKNKHPDSVGEKSKPVSHSWYSDQDTGSSMPVANIGKNKRFLFYKDCPDWLQGPPTLQFNGYQGSFPGTSDIDHSPPPSPEAKKEWNYTSNPHATITWTGKSLPFLAKST